ncbi:hypothetical protein [Sphingobium limneticum]|uniref:hypothetical protein n=1 Tax=Sphingobium limneticum TaxID=1007511 RepID=UPI001B860B0A|nr:hypothetical protein [Sphingobium limneticum]
MAAAQIGVGIYDRRHSLNRSIQHLCGIPAADASGRLSANDTAGTLFCRGGGCARRVSA